MNSSDIPLMLLSYKARIYAESHWSSQLISTLNELKIEMTNDVCVETLPDGILTTSSNGICEGGSNIQLTYMIIAKRFAQMENLKMTLRYLKEVFFVVNHSDRNLADSEKFHSFCFESLYEFGKFFADYSDDEIKPFTDGKFSSMYLNLSLFYFFSKNEKLDKKMFYLRRLKQCMKNYPNILKEHCLNLYEQDKFNLFLTRAFLTNRFKDVELAVDFLNEVQSPFLIETGISCIGGRLEHMTLDRIYILDVLEKLAKILAHGPNEIAKVKISSLKRKDLQFAVGLLLSKIYAERGDWQLGGEMGIEVLNAYKFSNQDEFNTIEEHLAYIDTQYIGMIGTNIFETLLSEGHPVEHAEHYANAMREIVGWRD